MKLSKNKLLKRLWFASQVVEYEYYCGSCGMPNQFAKCKNCNSENIIKEKNIVLVKG